MAKLSMKFRLKSVDSKTCGGLTSWSAAMKNRLKWLRRSRH